MWESEVILEAGSLAGLLKKLESYEKYMPDLPDYPAEWPFIARVIKHYARWHCEHCGHIHEVETGYMLTVHHLNGDKSDCRFQNLVALCQRCHLRIQATYYPGQMSFEPWSWAVTRGLM